MKNIGLTLKNARENKDYTQKRVMELTGINRKSLSGYENNVAEPDLNTFATLARLYDLSADEVLEIKPGHASLSLSRLETRMLLVFHSLSEERQREFLVQLEAFVQISRHSISFIHFFIVFFIVFFLIFLLE